MRTNSQTPTTGVEWLFWALGAGTVLVALGVWYVLKHGALAVRNAFARYKAGKAAGAQPQPVVAQQHTAAVGRDYADYEPAITRCVQFPGIGYMLMWAYRREGVVRRSIKLTDRQLARAVGASVFALPAMAWPAQVPLEFIEHAAVDEAEAFLARKCAGTSVVPRAVRADEAAQAPAAQAAAAPRRAQGDAAADHYAHRKTPTRSLESVEGVLQATGVYPRTMGRRQFEQYAVDVLRDEEGTYRMWGADLERALEAADVQPGDRVRIDFTGASPVALTDGNKTVKRHYVATVLEKAR